MQGERVVRRSGGPRSACHADMPARVHVHVPIVHVLTSHVLVGMPAIVPHEAALLVDAHMPGVLLLVRER